MSDQYVSESLLDVFIFEISQLIEQLEGLILLNEEESCYSEASLNEIFRIMHTIKGSSAMMMFTNISSLAHAMEDLFYYLRENKPEQVDCAELSDIILECIDFIKIEVEKIKNSDPLDGDYTSLLQKINSFLEGLKEINTVEEGNRFKIVVFFEDGCGMEHLRAFSIIHNLSEFSDEIHHVPEDIENGEDCVELIKDNGFAIYLTTKENSNEIKEFFNCTEFIREFKIEELSKENAKVILKEITEDITEEVESHEIVNKETVFEDTVSQPAKVRTEVLKQKITKKDEDAVVNKEEQLVSQQQSIISVGVSKLDKLMDLMGELVIAEAMVVQNPDLKGLLLDDFHKAARQLGKITDEMQDIVMSIRMVPLTATFHKMHRLLRDMSKKLGKEINLEIIGEETEVDKKIIEHISDPLMHLVRNAADHGFELPEEREEKGKNRVGTLTLEAKNAGGDVLIIIKDDGKGLSRKKILEKAKENGLLTKPEEEMLDREIFNLIFLPGFSTKASVSEFSGRGVGMDVVTKNIEMVGGTVTLDSVENRGTVVTLKIPLTLAIIDGMNIKVGNSHYTIPTTSVKEFFRPRKQDIITDPDNNEMVLLRGECYPIIRLCEYYHVKQAKVDLEEGIIIMVEHDETMFCIFADELLGQQQVVVKALPEYIRKLKKIKGLTGCTLLGGGTISLILDIADLVFG